ncbi:hypothetical protein HK098_003301 [Nowakowskiella sp. JEL0407]|nr:hypothetical protein HK098_003301 [Nowakowskiella sp. JEL0407]
MLRIARRVIVAHTFHTNAILRSMYLKWYERHLKLERKMEENEVLLGVAFHTRKSNLKFFSNWRNRFLERKNEWVKLAIAELHARNKRLQTSLSVLNQYVEYKKWTRYLKANAEEYFREICVVGVWKHWMRRIEDRKALKRDLKNMEHYRNVVLLQSGLRAFKINVEDMYQDRKKQEYAEIFHNRLLASKSLKLWLEYTELANFKIYLRRVSEHWCIHKVSKKFFIRWIQKLRSKRHEEMSRRLADARYSRILANRVLTSWNSYVSARKEKKEMVLEFVKECESGRTLSMFLEWKRKMKVKREFRVKCEMMQAKLEGEIALEVFNFWRSRTKREIEARNAELHKLQDVTCKLQNATLRRALDVWADFTHFQKRKKKLNEEALRFLKLKNTKRAFRVWRSLYVHKKWEKETNEASQNFRELSLLRNSLHVWKNKHPDWHEIYRSRNEYPIIHWALYSQRKALNAWKLYVEKKKERRLEVERAKEWRRNELIRIGVDQWLKYAEKLQSQRMEIALQNQSDTSMEKLRKVAKYARIWRAKTLANRAARLKNCIIAGDKMTESKIQSILHIKSNSISNKSNLGKLKASTSPKRTEPRIPKFYYNHINGKFENVQRQDFIPTIQPLIKISNSANIQKNENTEPAKLITNRQEITKPFKDENASTLFDDPTPEGRTREIMNIERKLKHYASLRDTYNDDLTMLQILRNQLNRIKNDESVEDNGIVIKLMTNIESVRERVSLYEKSEYEIRRDVEELDDRILALQKTGEV